MHHQLDLHVEFLEATTADLVDLIIALTTGDKPWPLLEAYDPTSEWTDADLPALAETFAEGTITSLWPGDLAGHPIFVELPGRSGSEPMPLTDRQVATLREVLRLHHDAENLASTYARVCGNHLTDVEAEHATEATALPPGGFDNGHEVILVSYTPNTCTSCACGDYTVTERAGQMRSALGGTIRYLTGRHGLTHQTAEQLTDAARRAALTGAKP